MQRVLARARRGVARASTVRRRLGPFLLIAGGLYLLMAAEGAAAPPVVSMTGSALAYTENAAATPIDTGLAINEPEADDIASATVLVNLGYQNGQDVLAFSDQLGITGAWNPGSGILTLTGTTTAANYETALRSVTYQNTSDTPDTSPRRIRVVVTDVNAESGFAERDLDVTAVDDPLDLTTSAGSLAYTEGAAPTPIDSALTLVDLDHNVTGATVQVTANYVNGEDVLAFSNQLGISGNWDAGTGTLTLSGTTTAADYQTALRTVTYVNTSENPTAPLVRTVTFTATSPGNSDSGVRAIALTAVNDPPSAGGATTVTDPGGGAANVLEDSVPSAANIRLTPPTVADVDGAPLPTQVRIVSVAGGALAQADGSAIGLGSGGSLLTLAGGSVDLRFAPAADRDTDASFDYVMVDGANSGINSSASTATIPIVAVNDAPTVALSGGSAAFVENGAPVAIDAGANVGDVDSANLVGATLQITGNYASGEDVLAFSNQLGVTGSWNAGTGTMTLSGSAPVADYQTAIRSVTYENTSDNPATVARTVTVTVDDGAAPSGGSTRSVTVAATNDAPAITTSGGSAAYTENAAAVVVDGALVAVDVDTPTLQSGSVQITGNYAAGQDVVAFTSQGGIVGSWDSGTGTLSLAGVATVSQWQSALRSVTYVNTSDAPSTAARTVTFVVSDGSATSASATRGITVSAVNDAPVVTASAGSVAYTENDGPVALDTGLTVVDVDNAPLAGATVAVTAGYWNGEDVLDFADQSGITGSWDATTGTMTLSGSASVAQYEAALRSVTYENVSDAPSSSARTVSFRVDDGTVDSNIVTRTVAVIPVNDLPVVTLAGGTATYTEDASPVALDGSLTVTDPDDAALGGARVTITGGYVPGEDTLGAIAAGGVSASWNPATGVLTLTGAASPSTYQTVLRGVTYVNTSQEPSTATRTVRVVVDDPSGSSAAVIRGVTVVSVNDAPVAANDSATTVQGAPVTVDVLANDSDAEGDALTLIAVGTSPHATATIGDGGVTVVPDAAYVGTLNVTYTVSDGAAQDSGVVTVTVTPAADLGVTLTAGPDPTRVGRDVDVDVVVRNAGPGTALGPVVVVDAGEARITRASTAGGRCEFLRGEAQCFLPDVANDASALVEVTIRTTRSGTMRMSAHAASASFDANSADDEAVATVRVNAALPVSSPVPDRSAPSSTTTVAAGPIATSSTTSTTRAPVTTTTGDSAGTPQPRGGEPAATTEEADGGGSGFGVVLGVMLLVVGALGALVLGLRRVQHG